MRRPGGVMTWVTACNANAACVRIRDTGNGIQMRDEADTILDFTYAEWEAFTAGVKAGEFDIDQRSE